MSVKWVAVIIISIIVICSIFLNIRPKTAKETFTPLVASPSVSPREIYTGAWVTDFWDNKTKTLNATNLVTFENTLNTKFAIANIYSEWAYLKDPKLITKLNEISSHSWTPMISSNPYFFKDCPKKNDSLYKTIANGDCDEFLNQAALNLKAFSKPIFLRFAWEMNLPNMYWSIKKTDSTPKDFINAWRRFYKITKKQEANNIIWVLSFNTTNSVTTPYAELFPGDDYIDWVAIDGYNWGNTHDWSGWSSFNGTFKDSYDELQALTNKPVMISEVNSAPTGTGGSKAEWLKDMLETQIPKNFPNIKAVVIFNEDKSESEKIDWRMEKSPEYIKVLRQYLENDIYKKSYP